MKSFKTVFLAIFLVIAVAFNSCKEPTIVEPSDDDTTGQFTPNAAGHAGVWTASVFSMTQSDNPLMEVDLINYGVTFTLTINADGSYSSSAVFAGQATNESGMLSFENDEFHIKPSNGDMRSGTFTFDGTMLDITVNNQEFDFDQNGTNESANLRMGLTK